MSHSKRNTSRAVFTSHERSLAKAAWGSTTARLSRESFLSFASCRLCLQPAVSPVSCSHGDIFCRECALSNILSQKKEIKRLQKAREKEEREAEENRDVEELEARERAVQEFERIQMGLEAKLGSAANGQKIVGREDGKIQVEEDVAGGKRGEKRKFELDEDELLRIAMEERTRARKAINDEKASKTTLPSFWVPSITPSSNTTTTLHNIISKTKASPICPASSPSSPHPYSLHTLITLHFTEEKTTSSAPTTQRICPSCKKALSNTSKATLAHPCGHVLCHRCVTQFMSTPPSSHDLHISNVESSNAITCFVCDTVLEGVEKKEKGGREKGREAGREGKDGDGKNERLADGLIEIQCEGTGFAGGGKNRVEKDGVAFQC